MSGGAKINPRLTLEGPNQHARIELAIEIYSLFAETRNMAKIARDRSLQYYRVNELVRTGRFYVRAKHKYKASEDWRLIPVSSCIGMSTRTINVLNREGTKSIGDIDKEISDGFLHEKAMIPGLGLSIFNEAKAYISHLKARSKAYEKNPAKFAKELSFYTDAMIGEIEDFKDHSRAQQAAYERERERQREEEEFLRKERNDARRIEADLLAIQNEKKAKQSIANYEAKIRDFETFVSSLRHPKWLMVLGIGTLICGTPIALLVQWLFFSVPHSFSRICWFIVYYGILPAWAWYGLFYVFYKNRQALAQKYDMDVSKMKAHLEKFKAGMPTSGIKVSI